MLNTQSKCQTYQAITVLNLIVALAYDFERINFYNQGGRRFTRLRRWIFGVRKTLRKLGHQDQCYFSFLIAPNFLFLTPWNWLQRIFLKKSTKVARFQGKTFLYDTSDNGQLHGWFAFSCQKKSGLWNRKELLAAGEFYLVGRTSSSLTEKLEMIHKLVP